MLGNDISGDLKEKEPKLRCLPAIIVPVVRAEEHAIMDSHGPVFPHQLRGSIHEGITSCPFVLVHGDLVLVSLILHCEPSVLCLHFVSFPVLHFDQKFRGSYPGKLANLIVPKPIFT